VSRPEVEGNLQVVRSVLIHAGAGGVGSIAIQLAKQWVLIIFWRAVLKLRFVKQLGADYAIDYKHESYVEVIPKHKVGIDLDHPDTIGGRHGGVWIKRNSPLWQIGHDRRPLQLPQSLLKAWGKNLTDWCR